jgi:hypothetical protein
MPLLSSAIWMYVVEKEGMKLGSGDLDARIRCRFNVQQTFWQPLLAKTISMSTGMLKMRF